MKKLPIAIVLILVAAASYWMVKQQSSQPGPIIENQSYSDPENNFGYLRARVISANSGIPLEGYRIFISPPDCIDKSAAEKTTDKAGTVIFTLDPGRYCIVDVRAPVNAELTFIPSSFRNANVTKGQVTDVEDIIAEQPWRGGL